jgi:hypothetical protein
MDGGWLTTSSGDFELARAPPSMLMLCYVFNPWLSLLFVLCSMSENVLQYCSDNSALPPVGGRSKPVSDGRN